MPFFLMTLCSYTRTRFDSHLTSSASHMHVQDDKDTIRSPRTSAILGPKKKQKNQAFYKGNKKNKKNKNKGKFSPPKGGGVREGELDRLEDNFKIGVPHLMTPCPTPRQGGFQCGSTRLPHRLTYPVRAKKMVCTTLGLEKYK